MFGYVLGMDSGESRIEMYGRLKSSSSSSLDPPLLGHGKWYANDFVHVHVVFVTKSIIRVTCYMYGIVPGVF